MLSETNQFPKNLRADHFRHSADVVPIARR
jgi:hypothetical protein